MVFEREPQESVLDLVSATECVDDAPCEFVDGDGETSRPLVTVKRGQRSRDTDQLAAQVDESAPAGPQFHPRVDLQERPELVNAAVGLRHA